jgi:DNA-directed RNA polymerase III subunit RPC4
MIASGPFAMGPANVTTERSASKTTFTGGPSAMAALGGEPSSLTNLPPPSLKRDQGKAKVEDLDDEVQEIYSDVEDGIEIIDINDVRKMDWMAPDSLRKEKQRKAQVKVEPFDDLQGAAIYALSEPVSHLLDEIATAARPSLISETDAELEIEDLIESFSASAADVGASVATQSLMLT